MSLQDAPKPQSDRRLPAMQRISRMFAAFVTAWGILFVPTCLAAMNAFESTWSRWAWPSVLGTAAVCGTYVYLIRKRRTDAMRGTLLGIGVGLLHAGLCFHGARV